VIRAQTLRVATERVKKNVSEEVVCKSEYGKCMCVCVVLYSIYYYYYYYILTANGVLPGGIGTTRTIRHSAQITHITENNTPHSNKTQHTELHKQ
jgi:hypothetical protein